MRVHSPDAGSYEVQAMWRLRHLAPRVRSRVVERAVDGLIRRLTTASPYDHLGTGPDDDRRRSVEWRRGDRPPRAPSRIERETVREAPIAVPSEEEDRFVTRPDRLRSGAARWRIGDRL